MFNDGEKAMEITTPAREEIPIREHSGHAVAVLLLLGSGQAGNTAPSIDGFPRRARFCFNKRKDNYDQSDTR